MYSKNVSQHCSRAELLLVKKIMLHQWRVIGNTEFNLSGQGIEPRPGELIE